MESNMRELANDELELVSGGTVCYDPCGCDNGETKLKGNNGWGNGGDPINKGSDEGATSGTKLDIVGGKFEAR
jgi:hypothetical protein